MKILGEIIKKEWTDSTYQKELDRCLLKSFNELKQEQIDWLTNNNIEV